MDASLALAWCFPDEGSDYADTVLVELKAKTVLVPSIWALELANALLVGERAKRLRPHDVERFISLMEALPLVQDSRPAVEQLATVTPCARDYGLTAHDAAYLELAVRNRAPLATLNARLRRAAQSAGVEIFAQA